MGLNLNPTIYYLLNLASVLPARGISDPIHEASNSLTLNKVKIGLLTNTFLPIYITSHLVRHLVFHFHDLQDFQKVQKSEITEIRKVFCAALSQQTYVQNRTRNKGC